MLFTIFIIVAILLGLALVGLGINILFRKNGKFPETHIGKNKAMKDRGIHCANTTDRKTINLSICNRNKAQTTFQPLACRSSIRHFRSLPLGCSNRIVASLPSAKAGKELKS